MIPMFLVTVVLQASAPADTLKISLEQATERGLAVSPAVAAARGAVSAPRGLRADAWWPFPENPSFEYGRVRRRSPGSESFDRDWSLTQEIEVAGQWAVRGGAANALVHAAESRVDDARRVGALEVRRAYVTLVMAERRRALTDSSAALADRLAQFARRQVEAGEASRLEVNAAVLEAARSRSTAERAAATAAEAAADLGRLLGLPADTTPVTAGLQSVPDLALRSDSALLGLATSRRPDLRANQSARISAERRVTLATLGLIPNVEISAVSGREGGTDQILGFTFGFRLPLFHWRAETGQAAADRAEARALEVSTQRAVRAEVLSAAARYQRARAAERRFETDVLQAAAENVTLTERAVVEGELGLTDVLVLRNTALAAQLEYLDVLRDAADAWFTLAAALGAEPAELPALLGGRD